MISSVYQPLGETKAELQGSEYKLLELIPSRYLRKSKCNVVF